MDKRSSFWKPFGSERVNKSQKLLKPGEKLLYLTFWSFRARLSWKKKIKVRSEILGLLVKILTVDYVYSRSNKEKLPLAIKFKLS